MGSIVRFVPRADAAEQQRRCPLGGGCEIVIFPGVRYERWDDDGASPTPKPQQGGKRGKRRRVQ